MASWEKYGYPPTRKKENKSIKEKAGLISHKMGHCIESKHSFPGRRAKLKPPLLGILAMERAIYLGTINFHINDKVNLGGGIHLIVALCTALCVSWWLNQIGIVSWSFKLWVKNSLSQNLGQEPYSKLLQSLPIFDCFSTGSRRKMAEGEIEELVVNLEKKMELSTLEDGVKLVGNAMAGKTLNKWGIRNILRSAWREFGEIEIKWVRDNTFIITTIDESTAQKILDQAPWAVMKQNFAVQRWPQELALEEVQMNMMSFWVQIRGLPPNMSSVENIKCLVSKIGEVLETEDPSKARGFLRAKVTFDTAKPLVSGCWIPRPNNNESWIEFRYERLQDFCYKCGRIGHANVECTFEAIKGGLAGYGEWTKAPPVRDIVQPPKQMASTYADRRLAGTTRKGSTRITLPEGEVGSGESGVRVDTVGEELSSSGRIEEQEVHSSLAIQKESTACLKEARKGSTGASAVGGRSDCNKRAPETKLDEELRYPQKKTKMIREDSLTIRGGGGWPSSAANQS